MVAWQMVAFLNNPLLMFLISYGYKLFEIITPLPPTDRLFIYRCDKTMQKWGMWNSTAQIMDLLS